MNFGVLGTGGVGRTLATKLVELGHEVKMGSRAAGNEAAGVMVDPGIVPGSHAMFVSGDEDGAKAEVAGLLESFGWDRDDIMDLGDITAARGPEMYLPLWLRLYGATGTGHLNIRVIVAS